MSVLQVPLVIIDSYFYGKFVLAPLNILLYNVFTARGPDIYGNQTDIIVCVHYYIIHIGTEPLSFYFKNMLLNMNVVFVLALLSVAAVILRVRL